jgi:Rad3-related DNA helicase
MDAQRTLLEQLTTVDRPKGDIARDIISKILGFNGLLGQYLSNSEYRPQQVSMAEVIINVILDGKKHGVVEAPTGSGKSLAYSIPAIIASLAKGKPVIISTSTKNLQAQLVEKDLPLLQQLFKKYFDLDFTYVVCKGRSNYFCLRRWHRFIDMQESKKKKRRRKKTVDVQIMMDEDMAVPESVSLAERRAKIKAALSTKEEREAFDLLMDWYMSDPVDRAALILARLSASDR